MEFDLEKKQARLSVGELADFGLGPRQGGEGAAGLWRAQLGTHWHAALRAETGRRHPAAEFEVRIEASLARRDWTIFLEGRIDQLVPEKGGLTLREIKSVTRALPADEAELRADYPSYFAQLAAYVALWSERERAAGRPLAIRSELVFVEVAGGIVQTVAVEADDSSALDRRLLGLIDFLESRRAAQARRLSLAFRPSFAAFRPGQEAAPGQLAAALAEAAAPILFQAPTGFGKTGIMLEAALGALRSGRCERVVYLSGKSTGQLQVVATLRAMLGPEGLPVWNVRPKTEHCINSVFHCRPEACAYLAGLAERWPKSGLQSLYLGPPGRALPPAESRAGENGSAMVDLARLRAEGERARICPYEITRAALPFSDVWVADYNYIFAPSNRGFFFDQPGFNPAATLLIIDEAHNLPGRVAAAHSSEFSAATALAVNDALVRSGAASDLILAWDAWTRFLEGLAGPGASGEELKEEVYRHLGRISELLRSRPPDYERLGPGVSELLWQAPVAEAQLADAELPRLSWSPQPGSLALTCLDAAAAIGPTLRQFGAVILATATPGPVEIFAEALGLADGGPRPAAGSHPGRFGQLNKSETRTLFKHLTSASLLLERKSGALFHLKAGAPWRTGAYEVACDLRVDTRFRSRSRHYSATADAIAALCRSAQTGGAGLRTAAFFPSYAYAESVRQELAERHPGIRVAAPPRQGGLEGQAGWLDRTAAAADVAFLILGSSFAEGVDFLGGKVTHAVVVGPALPEVNEVQRARQAALAGSGAEAAFHRVYRVPGMQKVNQALGRLVRAPGQRARILLHCRRFAETGYRSLLEEEYQPSFVINDDADAEAWLCR